MRCFNIPRRKYLPKTHPTDWKLGLRNVFSNLGRRGVTRFSMAITKTYSRDVTPGGPIFLQNLPPSKESRTFPLVGEKCLFVRTSLFLWRTFEAPVRSQMSSK